MKQETLRNWSAGWDIFRSRNGLIITLTSEPVSAVLSTARKELVLSGFLGENDEIDRVLKGAGMLSEEEGERRKEQIIQEVFRRAYLWLKGQPKEPRLPFP